MKNSTLLLALLGLCSQGITQNYTSYFIGNATDIVTQPTGGICLMGGSTESDNAMRWFLQSANGGDVLVLRASGSDGYNDYLYSELGVSVNSVETIVFNNAQAATDTYVLGRIARAEAIWLAGGDQYNYVSYWRGTEVANRINTAVAQRNIAIGGTSAGMAVLGGVYFSAQNGTVSSSTALDNPYNAQVSVSNVPFLDVPHLTRVVTDTHYDNPDRRGRHVAFVARAITDYGGPHYGIACDEYTAVCIDRQGLARVFGTYPDFDDNAYFLTPNCDIPNNTPETCTAGQPLTWDQDGQALKVYTAKGTPTGLYTFDLRDWQTGEGGTWEHWSVNNGALAIEPGTPPVCNPVSTTTPREGDATFKIYPNPTNKSVLQIEIAASPNGQMRLMDANGRVLKVWSTRQQQEQLDVSQLSAGTYFLEYSIGNARETRTLVVR